MTTFLPREVQEGLAQALSLEKAARSRLRVRAGTETFPILTFTDGSFSLASDQVPKLRGYVDILEGSRHMYRALIVASCVEGHETVFEFKSNTAITDRPARDFEVDVFAPAGLIEAI